MDLIPTPDQVVAAAGNVAHRVLHGQIADLRPTPRLLVDEGTQREVYHYRPAPGVAAHGDPVLLVSPLAAPALAFDLRRGCSVVEHLVGTGRPTYLVEYGEVSFRARTLGLEPWVDEIVPEAVTAASAHAGGRPVHVVGWSLGGIFAALVAADRADLPIASLSLLGAPFDVAQVPLVAPPRPLLDLDDLGVVSRTYRALGGATPPLVRWAVQLPAFQRLVTTPLALATRLDDTEFLAQVEAVGRFAAAMTAYPGRTFGQLYHRFVPGNALASGSIELGGRTISLADVTVPVKVFAGATDGIAPVDAVKAVVPLLTGSPDVQFEIVPGGHLGLLTGRAARSSTWAVLDEWMEEHAADVPTAPAPSPATRKAPARKAPARKAPARKAPARKAPVTKASATKAAATKAPSKKAPATKAASAKKAPATKAASAKKAPATKAAPAKKSATTAKAATTKAATTRKSAATKSAAKKSSTPRKSTANKSTAKKSTAKKSTSRRTAASTDSIGANPTRRYGSGGSRSLAR